MPQYWDKAKTLIERTARKPHRCIVAQRPDAYHRHGIACIRADGRIEPGERYVEYVGTAAPFQSGWAYHLGCAHAEWDEKITQMNQSFDETTRILRALDARGHV